MDDFFSPIQRCSSSKAAPPKQISLIGASESEILEALKTHCSNPQPVPTSPTNVKNIRIPDKNFASQNVQNCLSKFQMTDKEKEIAEKILNHWARNELHAMPVYTGTLAEFPEDFVKYGYTVEAYSAAESVYHTHKTKNAIKYKVFDKDKNVMGWEYVFDADSGKIVTATEDAGTYNIFPPGSIWSDAKHAYYDVFPYNAYGSGPTDTTTKSQRVLKPASDKFEKVKESTRAVEQKASDAMKKAKKAIYELFD